MSTNDIVVDKNANKVSWFWDGQEISIEYGDLDQAYLYRNAEVIFVLAGKNRYPDTLVIFSIDGKEKIKVKAPAKYAFSYLTDDLEVVCAGEEKIDGWYDWHFSVEPSTGKLTRRFPAY